MSEKLDITTGKLDEISENRGPVSEIINDSSRTGVLATPEDFTEPDKIYELLLEKIKQYHPSDDFSMIEKAYHIGDEAHQGQKRKSGEPYIIHPLCKPHHGAFVPAANDHVRRYSQLPPCRSSCALKTACASLRSHRS